MKIQMKKGTGLELQCIHVVTKGKKKDNREGFEPGPPVKRKLTGIRTQLKLGKSSFTEKNGQ